MFYFTPEGWKLFEKEITFKETVHIYDNSDEAYHEKEDMTSADVTLGDEQLRRLETIKNIHDISIEDVRNYVIYGSVPSEHLLDMSREINAEQTRQKLAKFITRENLTTEEMLGLLKNFKPYQVNSFYMTGDVFSYKNQLYKVIQTHRSQEDWLPEEVPALYLPIAPPSVIPEWKQPIGAHDSYIKGDKVLFNGKAYESLIAGNTWSPTAYPQGWKEIV